MPEASADLVATPVVSGLRVTGRGAWNWLGVGGHDRVVAREPTPVQEPPALGPALHLPETHLGHGDARLPVRKTREDSGKETVVVPRARSTVPLPSV